MNPSAPRFLQTFNNHDQDRLGFALLLALALHVIVLFGVGFTVDRPPQQAPSLEVTLAVTAAERAPENADFLAQSNQLGGGDQPDPSELSQVQVADFTETRVQEAQPVVESPAPPTPEDGTGPAPITALAPSSTTAAPVPPDTDVTDAAEPQPPPQVSEEIASLRAKLGRLRNAYSHLPNVLRITAVSTRADQAASYLDDWETVVEAVGNEHYPEEARRDRIFGNLRLAVRLRPDGTVDDVEILASSGQRVLDLAAIRTIRLAAPFKPFPAELREWDRMEIIRTWQFMPGNRLQTSGVE
ncbi:MAG: energy transducer TonB [Gammaproteobacteria bacterium]|nr:energy transducer TonB [Gammaproteobacteria bacterium]